MQAPRREIAPGEPVRASPGGARREACLLILIALAAGAGFVLAWLNAATRLVQSMPIVKCDLMVVLGGGARERIFTAADLLVAGACGRLLITQTAAGEESRALPADLGGPAGRYEIEVAKSHSTMEDAVVALRGARSAGCRSVLVVTSPYHTRRAAWIFSRVFKGSGVQFGVHPSGSLYFDYSRWWESPDGRTAVLSEYAKLCLCGVLSDLLIGFAAALA